MRRVFSAISLIAFFNSPIAFAQTAGATRSMTASPTPTIGATSPLGIAPNAPVGGTGVPLGATELATPGVSASGVGTPASNVSNAPACPALTTNVAGTSGEIGMTAPAGSTGANGGSFDGGGLTTAMGSTTSGTTSGAMVANCSPASMNAPSATAPTSAVVTGGVARPGIPLGSTEINNLGVSPPAVVQPVDPNASIQTSPCAATGMSGTSAMGTAC